MMGYLDDPERAAKVTAGGYYRTGDEARRDGRTVDRRLGISHDLPMLHYSVMPASSERLTIRELAHLSLLAHDVATRRF